MKKLIASFMFISLTSMSFAADYLGSYHCVATGGRQGGTDLSVDGRFSFSLHSDADKGVTLKNLVGHMSVSVYDDDDPLYDYYSVFTIKELPANPKYRPIVYKNHHQFKNLDDTASGGVESGMWGYLVLEKNPTKERKDLAAHYVFQAGDHMGGTIDLVCVININFRPAPLSRKFSLCSPPGMCQQFFSST